MQSEREIQKAADVLRLALNSFIASCDEREAVVSSFALAALLWVIGKEDTHPLGETATFSALLNEYNTGKTARDYDRTTSTH